MTAKLFDWLFFVLLFGIGTVTVCAKLVHDAYDRPENLPGWASTSKGELILTLNHM